MHRVIYLSFQNEIPGIRYTISHSMDSENIPPIRSSTMLTMSRLPPVIYLHGGHHSHIFQNSDILRSECLSSRAKLPLLSVYFYHHGYSERYGQSRYFQYPKMDKNGSARSNFHMISRRLVSVSSPESQDNSKTSSIVISDHSPSPDES